MASAARSHAAGDDIPHTDAPRVANWAMRRSGFASLARLLAMPYGRSVDMDEDTSTIVIAALALLVSAVSAYAAIRSAKTARNAERRQARARLTVAEWRPGSTPAQYRVTVSNVGFAGAVHPVVRLLDSAGQAIATSTVTVAPVHPAASVPIDISIPPQEMPPKYPLKIRLEWDPLEDERYGDNAITSKLTIPAPTQ
jgi:hypothetical protein